MKKLLAFALAALSIHASSQADVIYEWNSIGNTTPKDISMKLVFGDELIGQDSYAYTLHAGWPFNDSHYTGLKEISFSATGARPMSLFPGQQVEAPYLDLVLNLQFLAGGQLGGSIYFNDSQSDVRLASTDGVFSVLAMHSDANPDGSGISCDGVANCAWSTGTLNRLDSANQLESRAVPEPASVALVGLGLLGIASLRRRKPGPAR